MRERDTTKIREAFTFYRSFRDAVDMTNKEEQLVLYKAIADYALDGIEPDVSTLGVLGQLCWTAISPNIKSGRRNYINGCNGGAPEGNCNAKKQPKNNPNSTEKQPGQTSTKNKNRNKTKNKNDEESIEKVATKRTAFVAPSLQEVSDYISEKGYAVDARQFVDFYESKGWMVGSNKMKDWRAAVRTWTRRQNPANTPSHETQRPYELLD
ncbi:DUF6291 domain-containing protein [Alistipes sp.]|uniref:DUF6291 domain-containing protein n=1 Tax=Alistipes sp. TaxID=1872444 RepID=UPI0031FBAD88